MGRLSTKFLGSLLQGGAEHLQYKLDKKREYDDNEFKYNRDLDRRKAKQQYLEKEGYYDNINDASHSEIARRNSMIADTMGFTPIYKEKLKEFAPQKDAYQQEYDVAADIARNQKVPLSRAYQIMKGIEPKPKEPRSVAVKGDGSPAVAGAGDWDKYMNSMDKALERRRQIYSEEYSKDLADPQINEFVKVFETYDATEDENIRKELDSLLMKMPVQKRQRAKEIISHIRENTTTINSLKRFIPAYSDKTFYTGYGFKTKDEIANLTRGQTAKWADIINSVVPSDADRNALPAPTVADTPAPQNVIPVNPFLNPNLGATTLERGIADWENKRKIGIKSGTPVIEG